MLKWIPGFEKSASAEKHKIHHRVHLHFVLKQEVRISLAPQSLPFSQYLGKSSCNLILGFTSPEYEAKQVTSLQKKRKEKQKKKI